MTLRTFPARNFSATLSNSSHAESSWTRAEGARLMEGQRVTMEPNTIFINPINELLIRGPEVNEKLDLLHRRKDESIGTRVFL